MPLHGRISSLSPFSSASESPLGNVIFWRYPYFEPSMAFTTSTVTVWPIAAAKSARVTPTLLNHLGGLLSNFHLSTFPSLPFASMKTTIWGLVQSTLVRDPLRVTLVFMSKIAEGEWCAHKAAAGI